MSSLTTSNSFASWTVFSTPCDMSLEDCSKSKARSGLTLDEYILKKSTNSKFDSNSNDISQINTGVQGSVNQQTYDNIYQSYSKIWSDHQSMKQNNLNTLKGEGQILQPSKKNQSAFSNILLGQFSNYQLPQNQTQVSLIDLIKEQQLKNLKNGTIFNFCKNIQPQNKMVDILASTITQSFQIYSSHPTRTSNQIWNQRETSCFDSQALIKDQISFQNPSTKTASTKNSRISSPTFCPKTPNLTDNNFPSLSTATNSESMNTNNKVKTRSHLLADGIRQPDFMVDQKLMAPKLSETLDHNQHLNDLKNKQKCKINETHSQKTQGFGSNNSTRTKEEEEDEDDFDLSFDKDFFFDLQREDLDLDQ